MSFDPGIPAATDLLSQSQQDIQDNFSSSNTIFGLNHVNFDNSLPNPPLGGLGYATIPADEGKHTFVILKRIDTTTGTPGADPATGANESAFYAKYTGTRTEIYYRYPSSGPILQLSAMKAWCRFNGAAASPIAPLDGYNVANVVRGSTGVFTINFTTNLSNANYSVIITCYGQSGVQFNYGGVTSTAVGSCVINTRRYDTAIKDNVDTNPSIVNVLIIGN